VKIETHKPYSSGLGYYVAELEELGTINDPWYPDIDEWCENTFGQQDLWGEEPQTGWKRMGNKYFFVQEDKLSWFLIKWL